MKPSLALLAIMLLSISATACGGASKATGSAPQASSNAATTGSSSTKPTGTSAANPEGEGAGTVKLKAPTEASAPDRRAITALVKRYYAVAAADDGARACSLMYSTFAEGVPEDYGQPPGPPNLRGKTCAVIMSKLFKQLPREPSAVLAKTEVTDVRVRGRWGFVQLHSSAMPTGEISAERERGTWKIQGLIGRACTRCAGQHG
jgi:hypothetical protein